MTARRESKPSRVKPSTHRRAPSPGYRRRSPGRARARRPTTIPRQCSTQKKKGRSSADAAGPVPSAARRDQLKGRHTTVVGTTRSSGAGDLATYASVRPPNVISVAMYPRTGRRHRDYTWTGRVQSARKITSRHIASPIAEPPFADARRIAIDQPVNSAGCVPARSASCDQNEARAGSTGSSNQRQTRRAGRQNLVRRGTKLPVPKSRSTIQPTGLGVQPESHAGPRPARAPAGNLERPAAPAVRGREPHLRPPVQDRSASTDEQRLPRFCPSGCQRNRQPTILVVSVRRNTIGRRPSTSCPSRATSPVVVKKNGRQAVPAGDRERDQKSQPAGTSRKRFATALNVGGLPQLLFLRCRSADDEPARRHASQIVRWRLLVLRASRPTHTCKAAARTGNIASAGIDPPVSRTFSAGRGSRRRDRVGTNPNTVWPSSTSVRVIETRILHSSLPSSRPSCRSPPWGVGLHRLPCARPASAPRFGSGPRPERVEETNAELALDGCSRGDYLLSTRMPLGRGKRSPSKSHVPTMPPRSTAAQLSRPGWSCPGRECVWSPVRCSSGCYK